MNIRYVCKSTPDIKITKWFDTESDRVFYDLYIDDKYVTRCDTMREIFNNIEICLIGLTIKKEACNDKIY